MRSTAHILILMVIPAAALATEQEPDILFCDGLELSLRTGWGHPSPLQT